ncbi:MAG: hypothetical protein EOO56_07120 [Hymenobacter sp.]|nr:MAG: hypothetical protein EOO56_07120 [Hymenobacter sp.]
MERLDRFTIRGENGAIKIILTEVFNFPNSTCPWGGYDALATVKIKAGDFRVIAEFYLSTGQIYDLLQHLLVCNEQLCGAVQFASYEGNLKFTAQYDNSGHISLSGSFRANSQFNNKLRFVIATDQTFIQKTIRQLTVIVAKYGDNKGVII